MGLEKQNEILPHTTDESTHWHIIGLVQKFGAEICHGDINTSASGRFWGFLKKTPKCTWLCAGISPVW